MLVRILGGFFLKSLEKILTYFKTDIDITTLLFDSDSALLINCIKFV